MYAAEVLCSTSYSSWVTVKPVKKTRCCAMGPFRGRIAYPSYVDESLFGNPHEATVRKARTMPKDMNETVLVSGSELQGMMSRSRLGLPDPSAKQRDRTRLHELSNARKAQWPNTIEALRERKDKMRAEKFEVEEKLRLEIDREEEALQAEKRRLAIERANKMLYDSTDRVKSLHSKLMLADVMEERERQIELKARLRLREVESEERWYQKQQDAIRRMDVEEDVRDEEEMLKRSEVGRVRSEQIQSQMMEQAEKLAELQREGEMMKAMAIADAEAEQMQRLEEIEREKRARAEVRTRPLPSRAPGAPLRAPPSARRRTRAPVAQHPPTRPSVAPRAPMAFARPPSRWWRRTTTCSRSGRRTRSFRRPRSSVCSSMRPPKRKTCWSAATGRRSDSVSGRRGGSS